MESKYCMFIFCVIFLMSGVDIKQAHDIVKQNFFNKLQDFTYKEYSSEASAFYSENVKMSSSRHRKRRETPAYDDEFKRMIVDYHNALRRKETNAANMLKLIWNDDLAQAAAQYSESCGYTQPQAHSFFAQIFRRSPGYCSAQTWADTIRNWFYHQREYYNHATASCDDQNASSNCYEYRSIVNAKASEVGCWHSSCGPNDYFLVCNYKRIPPTIMPYSSTLFEEGDPCSSCPVEYDICDDGLCTDQTVNTSYEVTGFNTFCEELNDPAGGSIAGTAHGSTGLLPSGTYDADELVILHSHTPITCTVPELGADVQNYSGCDVGQEVEVDTTCDVICQDGYTSDIDNITCHINGSFSTTPTCTAFTCTVPKLGADVQDYSGCHVGQEVEVDTTCDVICRDGYTSDIDNITCHINGSFSTTPTCTAITCTVPELGADVQDYSGCHVGQEVEVDTTCDVICKDGHTSDIDNITCHINGSFSTTPTCTAITCTVPELCAEVKEYSGCDVGQEVEVDTTCDVICKDGYTSDIENITCHINGSFSTTPTCTAITCTVPELCAEVKDYSGCDVGQEVEVDTTCDVICKDGYTSDIHHITCHINGSFSTTPTCTAITCTVPELCAKVKDYSGCDVGQEVEVDTTCDVICKDGYTSDIHHITCHINGSFATTPTCTAITCTVPELGAEVKDYSGCDVGQEVEVDTTCDVICKDGYTSDIDNIICHINGSFSTTPTCTEITCSVPSLGTGVQKYFQCEVGKEESSGTICRFECKDGFTSDTDNITCNANGLFSVTPACTEITCSVPALGSGVQNYLQCAFGTEESIGTTCNYECKDGFTSVTDDITCYANGSFSTPICIDDPRGNDLWFIAIVCIIIFCVELVCVTMVCLVVQKRRKRAYERRSIPKSHISLPRSELRLSGYTI